MERVLLDAHAMVRARPFAPSAYVPLGRGAAAYESLFPLPRADEPALAYAERTESWLPSIFSSTYHLKLSPSSQRRFFERACTSRQQMLGKGRGCITRVLRLDFMPCRGQQRGAARR